MNENPFQLEGGSAGLVLVGDAANGLDHVISHGIEHSVGSELPEITRTTKRKINHSEYDEYGYSSTLKYLKRYPSEVEKVSSPLSVDSDVHIVRDITLQDGNYYISVIPRTSSSSILGSSFVEVDQDLDDKEVFSAAGEKDVGSGVVMLSDKDDLALCSVKEDEKVKGEMEISVSMPMGIPVTESMTLTVPSALTTEIEMNEESSEQDPLDHSYFRADEAPEVQSVDPVRTMWITTKADKMQLKQTGHTWKSGKWRQDEITLLQDNITKYCQNHGIKDAEQIIFHSTKEERKDFYPSICAGLNRPLFAVYRRVKRMYDKQNHRGRYTEEEVKQLKDLRAKHGRDWSLIGQQMGRSSDSVKDRCRLFKPPEKIDGATGKWTQNEEMKLAKAIHHLTGKGPGESVTEKISWGAVSEMVGTRTEKQCRTKWLNYLNWKLCEGEEWRKTDDRLLVERLDAMDVSVEEEIDWQKIWQVSPNARSPQWLRAKWSSLKKLYHAENPHVQTITLKALLKELYRIISAQLTNTWKRYERQTKTIDIPMYGTEDSIAAYKIAANLEEDSRSKFGVQIRPSPSPIISNPVFATVSNGNLDGNVTLSNDCHANQLGLPHTSASKHKSPQTVYEIQEHLIAEEQTAEVSAATTREIGAEIGETFQLNPTSSNVFLLQNSESNNPVVLFLSDDINNMNFTITSEALSLLNRASKSDDERHDHHGDEQDETDMIDRHHVDRDVMSSSDHHINISTSRTDVITTSDVLVYQETNNDDDIKNPVLSSAVHEVVTVGNEDEDCFIQSSSPLQGTLLEGTDLASASMTRIDDSQ